MIILYGIENKTIDVTSICLAKLRRNDIITIPAGDFARAYYFTDPVESVLKSIFIILNGNLMKFDDNALIKINIATGDIINLNASDINEKTLQIQNKLTLLYGSFQDELPEQRMAVRYLSGNEKILELGGNIGRNSLIISSILNDSSNLVTMESDPIIARQLTENRNINNMKFHVENSALSKRKLIQRGWETFVSDVLLDEHKWVKTITFEELKSKYDIAFDTLVLDCEGAFYYILMDMPEILNGIKLIIMENDYTNIAHKLYINRVLQANNFYVDYTEGGGWGPCTDYFYEVWKHKE